MASAKEITDALNITPATVVIPQTKASSVFALIAV
jgi:hypothetical protein